MPELPEVQTVVDDLVEAQIKGCVILKAQVKWPRSIHKLSPQTFKRCIRNRTVRNISRRGKFIVFMLDKGFLLIHLRMSGQLLLSDSRQPLQKHEHIILDLNDGRQLRFKDTRKFGRMYLVDEVNEITGGLGPEPLDKSLTHKSFKTMLLRYRRMLKPLLLDQSFIAGLGNIYVDEALWEARLHPERNTESLTDMEINCLHKAIPKVLQRGLKNLGTTLGSGAANFYSVSKRKGRNRDQLKVFRRTDLPCPRCKTSIQRIIVGQRSTHICPKCQTV